LVRLLRDFKQEKLIEANAKTIKIQNLSRLIKVANFY
jgi:hypothetical protein